MTLRLKEYSIIFDEYLTQTLNESSALEAERNKTSKDTSDGRLKRKQLREIRINYNKIRIQATDIKEYLYVTYEVNFNIFFSFIIFFGFSVWISVKNGM